MLSLTNDERKVALFFLSVFFLGIGINYLGKKFIPVRKIARIDEDFAKVNLNSCDQKQLESLPGLGEKLSQRIIQYRNEHGPFKSLDELKNIKGVTEWRFEKVRQSLKIKGN